MGRISKRSHEIKKSSVKPKQYFLYFIHFKSHMQYIPTIVSRGC